MERSQLIELLENPQESLGVEVKGWLNPEDTTQAATIVRALVALRNFDGGILILGLDNKSLEPLEVGRPDNWREIYRADKIQALVGKLAIPSFEILFHLIPRSDAEFPVIIVPGGVRSPVMARSTKPVTQRDWEELFARCFANREVDVGQFIQRHVPQFLTFLEEEQITIRSTQQAEDEKIETSQVESPRLTVTQEVRRVTFEFLQQGNDRFEKRVNEMRSAKKIPDLPPHGAWEVAFTIAEQELDFLASDKFLDRLFVNQPRYTGWPCWIDSRNFSNQNAHPYPYDHGWEVLIVRLEQNFFYNHIDFWRIEPRGRFYQRRALEDDIIASRGGQIIPALQSLDFLLVIARVAEAIGVGLQFVKGLGCEPETTLLSFAFRWTKLTGRQLESWAEPGRTLFPGSKAI